jgi:hypothetical protein
VAIAVVPILSKGIGYGATDGVVEIDGLYLGGKPRRDKNYCALGGGRKGQPKILKTPALLAVQRPPDLSVVGSPSGETRAAMIEDLSEIDRILNEAIDPSAHLMSDEWEAFVSLGGAFAAHGTVHHKAREYARGPVHIKSAECSNDRIRRTVSGVFHHISPHLADLYFNGDWLSLVAACRHGPSAATHMQKTADDQDVVGENTACALTPSCVPLRHRTRDARKRLAGSTSSRRCLCLVDDAGLRLGADLVPTPSSHHR